MPSPGGVKGKLRQGALGSPIKGRQSHIHSSSKAFALWYCFPGTGLGDPKTGQASPWDVHSHGLCPCNKVTSPVPATHGHTPVHAVRLPCTLHWQGHFPAHPQLMPCTPSPHAHTSIPLCTPSIPGTPYTMGTLIPTPHISHAMHTPLPVHTHSMPHVFTLCHTHSLTLHTLLPTHMYPCCAHSPHTLHSQCPSHTQSHCPRSPILRTVALHPTHTLPTLGARS